VLLPAVAVQEVPVVALLVLMRLQTRAVVAVAREAAAAELPLAGPVVPVW